MMEKQQTLSREKNKTVNKTTLRRWLVFICICSIVITGILGGNLVRNSSTSHTYLHYIMSSLTTHDHPGAEVSHPLPELPQQSGFHLGNLTHQFFHEKLGSATHDHPGAKVSDPSTEIPQQLGFRLGYLTSQFLHEQLGNALPATTQLYYFSERYWKLGLIEPFVLESTLSLMPPHNISKATPLSTYFNRSDYINHIQKCFKSPISLSSYTDFLVKAARTFVYLRITKEKNITDPIAECEMNLKPIERRLNTHVNQVRDLAHAEHGENYLFSGWKTLCVKTNEEHPFYMNRVGASVRKLIAPSCKNTSEVCLPEVTLVISEWRRIVGYKSDFFFTDPEFSDHSKYCVLSDLSPTSFIIDTARQFLQSLSLKRPFIGIHLRSEVLREYNKSVDKCMKRLNESFHVAKEKYSVQQDNVVMICDVRQHGGSNSIDEQDEKLSELVVARIEQLTNVSIVKFEPKSQYLASFSGLVPLVEREFLASADALVTIGGGMFQDMITKRFLQLHPLDDLFKIC